MNKFKFFVLLALAVAAAAFVWQRRPESSVRAALQGLPQSADSAGYARVTGPQRLSFPADAGPHPDYQTEWWYYTGNLDSADGRHFGYQFTIFRRATVPPAQRVARNSDWTADQVYLAHFALTDVAGRRYQAFERLSRGGAGLAGAASPPYHVWLEDWQVQQVGDDPAVTRIQARAGDVALDLTLTDRKGLVLHGKDGYSQKGPDPGNASIYTSLTRLESAGTVTVAGQRFQVSGLSWKDQEYSTSALAPDQVGWDWFALQLDDGSELKTFHIRRADGSVDPFSAGTFVDADGALTHLTRDDFTIEVTARWRSPHSDATYPAGWVVSVPSLGLRLKVEPWLADQELNVSYTYWEGAVKLSGQRGDRAVRGNGYVEMTGYAGSMQGQF